MELMSGLFYLTSKEIKALLNLSDCKLMHLRTSGSLKYLKQGNRYMYQVPDSTTLLELPVGQKLLYWYKGRHSIPSSNQPLMHASVKALEQLTYNILMPLQRRFGDVDITYGFTSNELKKVIARNSPRGTSPSLDQHASFELNDNGNQICSRGGAACDVLSSQVSSKEMLKYIVNELDFDRLYYYGDMRPIHISWSEKPLKHLQVMKETHAGKRYPGKKAFGKESIELVETL